MRNINLILLGLVLTILAPAIASEVLESVSKWRPEPLRDDAAYACAGNPCPKPYPPQRNGWPSQQTPPQTNR